MTFVDKETVDALEKVMTNPPKGINPIETDIGRKVVYRAAPLYEPEEGILSSLSKVDNAVFVRYGNAVSGTATFTSDLDWAVGGDSKPPAPALAPVREGQGDSEPRKAHYGDGEQPWDVIVRLGWGPAFAASNVIKYLRRTKNPEHSLESARWYADRLEDGMMGKIPGWTNPEAVALWRNAFDKVTGELSLDEIRTLRGSAASV